MHVHKTALGLLQQLAKLSLDCFWIDVCNGRTGDQARWIAQFRKQAFQQVMLPRAGTAPFLNDRFWVARTGPGVGHIADQQKGFLEIDLLSRFEQSAFDGF